MNCQRCQTPLPDTVSTFGPPGDERCFSCHAQILEWQRQIARLLENAGRVKNELVGLQIAYDGEELNSILYWKRMELMGKIENFGRGSKQHERHVRRSKPLYSR